MKRNILKHFLGSLILILPFISCAQGEHPPKKHLKPAELIEKMDADKDGKLSASEVKGPLKKDFSKVDINEDGYLTKEELKNTPKPPPRR